MNKAIPIILFAVCLFLVDACGPTKKAPSDVNATTTNEEPVTKKAPSDVNATTTDEESVTKKATSDVTVTATDEGLVVIGTGEGLSQNMANLEAIQQAKFRLFEYMERAMAKTDAMYGLAEGSHSINQLPSMMTVGYQRFQTANRTYGINVKLLISWSDIEELVAAYYEGLPSSDVIKNQPLSVFSERIINNLH